MSHPNGSSWCLLFADVSYRHIVIAPTPGPLDKLRWGQMEVRQRDGALLGVGLHSGLPVDEVARAVDYVWGTSDGTGRGRALMRRLQERTQQAMHDGVLRTVPEILAACRGEHGVLLWRAGPNGVAVARDGQIALVSEDLRYAALQRMGLDIGPLRPFADTNPWQWLADEVSGLTDLESTESSRLEAPVGEGKVVLLMSRGSLPFSPPSDPISTEDWWSLGAGWRHGLVGELVAIARNDDIQDAEGVIDRLRHEVDKASRRG